MVCYTLMKTLFISDLHLSASHPEISNLFLDFLEQYHPKNNSQTPVQALYILGDLFETWIGDDTTDPHDNQIINALRHYTEQGVPLYFMRGNRDFLIGKQFVQKTKCILLNDPTIIYLDGQRVLLMHGDLLCTLDTRYQWFRKIAQSSLIKYLFLSLPFSWRHMLAQKIRNFSESLKRSNLNNHSKNKQPLMSEAKYDATPMAIQKQLERHKAQLLIHGHTHRGGIHADRIVLGDWGKTGSVLIVDDKTMCLKTVEHSKNA